ncbi:hypothetical protein CFAM422_008886 [Trichoderma lentiforme]|uniref:IBR domain-containing protein n=1 Tax=Trichoderma lentiforme TaxID=1567552 RepID=A0A9P5CAY7_9HYPO|nr:hypothetical protein CFAM422_008886 [Trichoderma lentiforme]
MESNIDQATRQLIINLQLQDANALIKGKHRVGDPPPDAEIAARLYQQELRSLETFYADQAQADPLTAVTGTVHTEDFQSDTQTDKADEVNHDEKADRQDEELALTDDAAPAVFILKEAEEDSQSEDDSQSEEDSQAEKTKGAIERCIACMEEILLAKTLTCPCDHVYCHGCMNELFRLAMLDEHSFPPGCCGKAISLGVCRELLSAEQIREYEMKELEYSTENRTYCYLPGCSAFIPPSLIHGEAGTCGKCECKTCISCKGPSHEDECPDDEATQDLFRIASEKG